MSVSETHIHVRSANLSDQAFIVQFNARLAEESEGKTLDLAVLENGVKQALTNSGRLRYWIAEVGGQVAGQAAISWEWSDWRNGWIWWLQSVYVQTPYRGVGVFRSLLAEIQNSARVEQDVIGLRLYVEDHNLAAHKVYQAVGFQPGGYQVYELFWGQADSAVPE